MGWKFRCLKPGSWVKKKLFSPEVREIFLSPNSLLQNGHKEVFPGLKRSAREFDHSIPSRVEVKNEWSCIFNPTIYLDEKEEAILPSELYIKIVNTLHCLSPINLTLMQFIRQTDDTEHHIPVGTLLLLMGQVQILNIFLQTGPRGFPLSS